MDKRREANIRVKKSITETLFSLMKRKNLSEITVTEIIREADVARASFYRNYTSKEDVLFTLIRDILNQFREEADYDLEEYYSYHHILRCFQYFKRYDGYMVDLYRSGFGTTLLEELNQFHESIAGTMKAHSTTRYHLYMFIGALYNTVMVWLLSGEKEPEEEIAALFCREINKVRTES